MRQQKGQVGVILLLLVVAGFVLYSNFSGKSIFPSSPAKSTAGQGTKISAPTKKEPSPTPTPTPAGPDTTPPKRLNPQPKNKSSLPAETRKITLGLETNEKATCKYGTATSVDYYAMQGFFDQTNAFSHSTLISYLSEGGAYRYFIRCLDESGNKNTDDFIVSFTVKLPEDKTPPVFTNPSHQGDVLLKDTKEVVISISTNEVSSCRYSTAPGKTYSQMSGSFSYYDQTKRFHIKTITGLENGKTYDFYVRCKDSAGNMNTGDVLIRFSVATI